MWVLSSVYVRLVRGMGEATVVLSVVPSLMSSWPMRRTVVTKCAWFTQSKE